MVGNLIKAPLVAVLYASLLRFIAGFLPFSAFYQEMMGELALEQGWLNHLWLVGYCLFVCVIAAIAFSVLDKVGLGAFLHLLPIFLGVQWIVPMLEPFLFGEVSGVMEQWDIVLRFIQCAAATIVMLLLSMLLYTGKQPPEKPKTAEPEDEAADPKAKKKKKAANGAKQRLNIVRLLLLWMLALPGAFFFLYFVGGYFLGWRNEAVRAYYDGGADAGLVYMLVSMLLDDIRYAGMALIKGLLLAGFSLLLMMRLPGKRLLFLFLNVMLYLSQALLYLIPTPTMAWAVRLPHLIAAGAVLAAYGALSAFLLPMGYYDGERETPAQEKAGLEDPKAKKIPPGAK